MTSEQELQLFLKEISELQFFFNEVNAILAQEKLEKILGIKIKRIINLADYSLN